MVEAAILLLAFVAGAIPFSNLMARATVGVDLRDTEYNTVSGTSLYRVSGFMPLACSGLLDVGKGALAPAIAGNRLVLAAFAGGLAVAGHNWSPFLGGKGGRGIAPALGALAVNAWPGVFLLLAALVLGKAIRQTGLGGFVGEVLLVPVLALTNGGFGALAGAAITVPMLIKRLVGNTRPPSRGWRPYARRLVFDHDLGSSAP
jgi:glycerol-3-phosphate acyltransferase PlsY